MNHISGRKDADMKQYLLSITTGKPNHSIWFLMDPTDYLRSNRVYDDHAKAKAAMRKSIADYFSAFKSSKENRTEGIFDPNGQPSFKSERLNYDHMDYGSMQKLISRILFEPEYIPALKDIPLVSTAVDDYDFDASFQVQCDKKMVLVYSEYPSYSIKFNIHDRTLKEDGCYYFSFRIGEEAYSIRKEVFSAILCPLSDEGILDKRFPGKRYIEKTVEQAAGYFEGGLTGHVAFQDVLDLLRQAKEERSDKDDQSEQLPETNDDES